MKEFFARYRGSISGLDAHGSTFVWSTEHDEGQPTRVWTCDLASGNLEWQQLECGSTAQLVDDGVVWIGGTDQRLHSGKVGDVPKPFTDAFDDRIAALAVYDAGIAVVAGDSLHLVPRKGKGKTTSFELGVEGRSIATDASGAWIVVGTTRGHVIVFSKDDGTFSETARERLHDGEVTALAFEPDELRVYSTGADRRLLLSFVRGSFDTEDRGGTNMHENEVRAIEIGPDFETEDGTKKRFYTAGLDSSIKSWPRGRGGSQRPSTQASSVVQTSYLTVIDGEEGPQLVAAGLDGSIRVFGFDEEGRVGDCTTRVRDAYARAEDAFHSTKPTDRQDTLEDLARYADMRSLQLMAEHLRSRETDHKIQVAGIELLCGVDHAKTSGHLESFFQHGSSDVRLAAYDGLMKRDDVDPLDIIRLAGASGHEDLGLRAVASAKDDGGDAAVDVLREQLDHAQLPVRLAALTALEEHFAPTPDGTLAGLRSTHADIRRTAIVRLQKRDQLGNPRVDSRLRRLWDDDDQRTRLWAFVVSAHRRPNLVKALRVVDEDFHRQVFELEEFGKDENKRRKEVPKPKAFDAKKLDEADFRPLLEAMGSRAIDVSLRGARGLAALGDARSFGALLQLSREADSGSRVAVCKALAKLGDPRSVKRIRAMLHDADAGVRDAAVSALTSLQPDTPLDTSRAALSGQYSDVRERGLALLSKTAKANKGPLSEEASAQFEMALNDDDQNIRLEAFKALLNMAPTDHAVDTLRFVLRSTQFDVRREVMREAMAHPKDEAHRALLLELFDDENGVIRRETLEFVLDRWASTEHERIFRAGLGSTHAQMRTLTVEHLARQKGDVRKLLVEALDDEDNKVRLEAVSALVQAENRALLANALKSEHLDVRVEAATALAALGDQRALSPLVEVVDGYHELVATKPSDDALASYKRVLEVAMRGIQQLGHPGAIDAVISLIDGDDVNVAQGAAGALPGIAAPENLDKIRTLTKHENDQVRLCAALALAYNGDASIAPTLFGKTQPQFEVYAALGLRDADPERLLGYVDSEDGSVRNLALALVLMLELTEHTGEGIPERCLSLLSAENPYIRLAAAEALEHYGDQPKFYEWVYAMLNGLSSTAEPWSAEPAKLLALSRAVTLGEPRVSVRAAQVVAQLLAPKADGFETQFALFRDRYDDLLKTLEKRANNLESRPLKDRVARAWHRIKAKAKSLVVEPASFDEALVALSFGAYVGLARQQHAANAHHLRSAAISGLARLAPRDDRFGADAISVLLLALGDNNQTVRERAFDTLQALGATDEVVSTEALSTGFSDMGFRGLELLAADPDGGEQLLQQTLVESTNGLEQEAAKLLADRAGWTEVYRIGLAAASESFRGTSVRGLAEEYANDDKAADALRGALDSRHDDVRFHAARELAKKKDGAAYDTLLEMLSDEDGTTRYQGIAGLEVLRDERTANDLVDLVADKEDDVELDVSRVLNSAASYGDISIANGLLGFIDGGDHRNEAFEAALTLTGYQQYEWTDDEDVTPSWEESLEPRHPDFFGELIDLAYRISHHEMLGKLVGLSKWPPPSEALDKTLGELLTFSHDHIRHRAVEIVGWRLRHRDGPADGLQSTLTSGDVLDQFYAAEGLALAGHDDGLAVLRTAVDAMDDWSLRGRAVLALGTLADPTTVDMLLQLADDDTNYLQQQAAEAIGHMSASDRADEVFAILQRLATSSGYDTKEAALRGLRWFDSPGSWDILRREAQSDSWWIAQKCVELLRFDEGSRDVVERVLRENDDWDVANSAVASLRHMSGPDSLEPDYLIMQATVTGLDDYDDALKRIREEGDASRILDVLAKVPDENASEMVAPLVAILLSREPLPVAEAAQMLGSDKSRTAKVAAQIVGRAGEDAAKKHGKALVAATKGAREAWLDAWQSFIANHAGAREKLDDVATSYRKMVWAAGQVRVGTDEILAAAALPDHELALPIREEAVSTLGEQWFGKEGVKALVELAGGGDARLRSMAAAELDRAAPKESAKLLDKSLHDDVSFGRLIKSLDGDTATSSLRGAVAKASGIALPRLAALGDIDGLKAAMLDGELGDATRRGAIDALGTIVSDEAATTLAAFGAKEDEDEMLRKAAWRARRRVTRAIAAQEAQQ